MVQTTLITVSGAHSPGEREILAGPALTPTTPQDLQAQGFDVRTTVSVADDRNGIEDALQAPEAHKGEAA